MLHNLFKFNAATGSEPDRFEVRAFCGGDATMGLLPPNRIPQHLQCPDCAVVMARMVQLEQRLDATFATAKHALLLAFVYGKGALDAPLQMAAEDGLVAVQVELRAVEQDKAAPSAARS